MPEAAHEAHAEGRDGAGARAGSMDNLNTYQHKEVVLLLFLCCVLLCVLLDCPPDGKPGHVRQY